MNDLLFSSCLSISNWFKNRTLTMLLQNSVGHYLLKICFQPFRRFFFWMAEAEFQVHYYCVVLLLNILDLCWIRIFFKSFFICCFTCQFRSPIIWRGLLQMKGNEVLLLLGTCKSQFLCVTGVGVRRWGLLLVKSSEQSDALGHENAWTFQENRCTTK